MDLAIQRLSHFRKHSSRHFVGFHSCIYLFDIPLASGKTSMQFNHVDRIFDPTHTATDSIPESSFVQRLMMRTIAWQVPITHFGHAPFA